MEEKSFYLAALVPRSQLKIKRNWFLSKIPNYAPRRLEKKEKNEKIR